MQGIHANKEKSWQIIWSDPNDIRKHEDCLHDLRMKNAELASDLSVALIRLATVEVCALF